MALWRWVQILRGPAAVFAGPEQPCSGVCRSHMALQGQAQTLRGPAALGAGAARSRSTVCKRRAPWQRPWRSPGCGSRAAPRHRLHPLPGAVLPQRLQVPHGPAAPCQPGTAPQRFPGPLSALRHFWQAGRRTVRRRHVLGGSCTRGRDGRSGAGASAGATPVPVPAQLEGAGLGSAVPGPPWQLRGGRRRWWGPWGKSSVFNVPDSHLFLKQTSFVAQPYTKR